MSDRGRAGGGDGDAGAVRVPAGELTRSIAAILTSAGVGSDDADTIADVLVRTEERGNPSHGVAHLFLYLEYLEAGTADPAARPSVVRREGATALIDGGRGLGPVTAVAGMDLALDLAQEHGVGCVVVRNAMTFSAASYYANRALERDMIGWALSNSGAIMAPHGGVRRILGNSPFAIGVPSAAVPFVLDMACSATARGNIRLAADRGERLAPGQAISADGRPTTDPEEALSGSVLPFGGHKGYGLALAIECMTGLLSGAPLDHDDAFPPYVRPTARSFTFVAVDVGRFTDVQAFRETTARYLRQITESPSQGGDPILYPGLRAARAQETMRDGVPLGGDLRTRLERAARTYGVEDALPWKHGDDATR